MLCLPIRFVACLSQGPLENETFLRKRKRLGAYLIGPDLGKCHLVILSPARSGIGSEDRTAAPQRIAHSEGGEPLKLAHPDVRVAQKEAMDKQHRLLLQILPEM